MLQELEAKTFLKENNIHFIVVSSQEQRVGVASYEFLTTVYKNDEIEIVSF